MSRTDKRKKKLAEMVTPDVITDWLEAGATSIAIEGDRIEIKADKPVTYPFIHTPTTYVTETTDSVGSDVAHVYACDPSGCDNPAHFHGNNDAFTITNEPLYKEKTSGHYAPEEYSD